MNKLIVLVLLYHLSMVVPAHIGVDFHAKVKVSDKVRSFIRNIQRAAEAGYAAYKENQEGQENLEKGSGESATNIRPAGSGESNQHSDAEEKEDKCKRSGGKNCKIPRAVNNINV